MGHRISGNDTTNDQVLEQPGDRGQAPLDRARRQARFTVLDPNHFRAAARLALRDDERQNVRSVDILGRLAHHQKEHLQIERSSQHRIRTRSGGHRAEIVVEKLMTESRDAATGRSN
jgi:hypothetical protein